MHGAASSNDCALSNMAAREYNCIGPNQNIVPDFRAWIVRSLVYDQNIAFLEIPAATHDRHIGTDTHVVTDNEVLGSGREMIEAANRALTSDDDPTCLGLYHRECFHHRPMSKRDPIRDLHYCLVTYETSVLQKVVERCNNARNKVPLQRADDWMRQIASPLSRSGRIVQLMFPGLTI